MAGLKKSWQATRHACYSHLATQELFRWVAGRVVCGRGGVRPRVCLYVCRMRTPPKLKAREVLSAEIGNTKKVQPYSSRYFLPGKIAGKAAIFLLDSRCTTNLLSHCLFDTLSTRDQAGLKPYKSEHGWWMGHVYPSTASLTWLEESKIE